MLVRETLSAATAIPLLFACHVAHAQVVVLSADFDDTIPPQIAGPVDRLGVAGYAGLGSPSNQFAGSLLHCNFPGPGGVGNIVQTPVTVSLSGLPSHTALRISFLLAIIDSWDGTWPDWSSPDIFTVRIDGVTVFANTFANARTSEYQGYVPGLGIALTPIPPTTDRFGTSNWPDAAYDMSLEPALASVPHSSPSALIEFIAGGAGWQAYPDETWAIDNLVVSVDGGCYPNCDSSTTAPALNINDFICFLNKFAASDTYANCDQSTAAPTLNVLDFTCFLNHFAAGCP